MIELLLDFGGLEILHALDRNENSPYDIALRCHFSQGQELLDVNRFLKKKTLSKTLSSPHHPRIIYRPFSPQGKHLNIHIYIYLLVFFLPVLFLLPDRKFGS
jgi:hypothetical protein